MKKKIFLPLALFFICCEAIFLEDISEDTISIIAPAQNTTVSSGTIWFDWEELDGADSYQIQIAIPNFQEAQQLLLDSITTNLSISTDLTEGIHEWRVRGLNSEYETSYTITSFIVN